MMGNLKTLRQGIGRIVGVAMLAAFCMVGASARTAMQPTTIQMMDRAESNALIAQVQSQLYKIVDDTETLKSLDRFWSQQTPEEYAGYLTSIKVAVNHAQADLDRVLAMESRLTPLQIETVAKLHKDLNNVARNTQEAIQTFDANHDMARLATSEFANEVASINEDASTAHRLATDYFTVVHDGRREKQAMKDYERTS